MNQEYQQPKNDYQTGYSGHEERYPAFSAYPLAILLAKTAAFDFYHEMLTKGY
jgi:hypothetical protein